MENKVIGLELGSSNLKIVDVRKKGKGLYIQSATVIPTPLGSINDGEILDLEKLVEAIENTLKVKKINTEAISVLIKSSQVITREVIMKANNAKEVGALLHYSAGDYIPIDASRYELSYKILESIEDEEGKKQKLLLTATPKIIVSEVIRLISKLKLRGVGLYAQTDMIGQAFEKDTGIVGNKENHCVVVDLGGSSTGFTVVSQHNGVIHQQIEFGFDVINEWISQNFEDKSISELEGFKQKHAVIYRDDEFGGDNPTGAYISTLIKPAIDRQLVEGLIRFIELHEKRTSGQATIKKIYLIGGGSELKNLISYIQYRIGLPTEQVKELEGVTTNQREETHIYMPYLPSVLAATIGKGMNLLPEYYFKSRQNRRYVMLALGLVLVESLVFAWKAYEPIGQEKKAQKELIEVETALQDPKFNEVKEISKTLSEQKREQETWDNIILGLESKPFIQVDLLDTLIANLPVGVTIDQMNIVESSSTINFSGKSSNYYSVMNYGTTLQRLCPQGVVTYQVDATKSSKDQNIEEVTYTGYSITIQLPKVEKAVESTTAAEISEETSKGGEG